MRALVVSKWVVVLALLSAVPAAACDTPGFEAPVTVKADLPGFGIIHEMQGRYRFQCGSLRLDFRADDPEYPSDVTVIANQKDHKIYIVVEASRSYFEQSYSEKHLDDLHDLVAPFKSVFADDKKRQRLGERHLANGKCIEYAFQSSEGKGSACLIDGDSDRPVRIQAELVDGSRIEQNVGPYSSKSFEAALFAKPIGYRKEDESVQGLFSTFLTSPKTPSKREHQGHSGMLPTLENHRGMTAGEID